MKHKEVIKGDYIYQEGDDLSQVKKITGYVYVRPNATFDAPVLENVGGYVYVDENATFDAPVLENVGGSVDVKLNKPLDN